MGVQVESKLVEIIRHQLRLRNDQIWIGFQNKKIPPTNDLFVVVGMISARPIGNIRKFFPEFTTPKEVQYVNLNGLFQVDIFSSDNTALFRNWEIITALNSQYSVTQQERHQFKIFPITQPMMNTSQQIGGSQIYKYSITLTVQWVNELESDPYYFDSFNIEAGDEANLSEVKISY